MNLMNAWVLFPIGIETSSSIWVGLSLWVFRKRLNGRWSRLIWRGWHTSMSNPCGCTQIFGCTLCAALFNGVEFWWSHRFSILILDVEFKIKTKRPKSMKMIARDETLYDWEKVQNTGGMLSADPQVLWIASNDDIGTLPRACNTRWFIWWFPYCKLLLLPTPKKLLNASVVFLTRTFNEPMRRNPRSFSVNN